MIFKRVRVRRKDIEKFEQRNGYYGQGLYALKHLVIEFDVNGKVLSYVYRGSIRPVNPFILGEIFRLAFYGSIGQRIDLLVTKKFK